VNVAIIYWTSHSLSEVLGANWTNLERFFIIVLIEHAILAIKLIIAVVIKDKPSWISIEEHEIKRTMPYIYEILEDKK